MFSICYVILAYMAAPRRSGKRKWRMRACIETIDAQIKAY